MSRIRVLFLLALVCCTSAALAANGISLATTKGNDTELEINSPDVEFSKIDVAGRQAMKVSLTGGAQSFEKNSPELPFFSALVMVDPIKKPKVKISSIQSEVIRLDVPVVPSRGNFTRDIDPINVPFVFGPAYSENKWYPSSDKLATIEAPFRFRDVRGVRLLVNPIQYNPVKNLLKIHRRFKVSIQGDGRDNRNIIETPIRISRVFEPYYKQAFINYKPLTKDLPKLQENGRLLIICFDDFAEAMVPFIAWKKKCGIEVTFAKSSEAGKTAAEIKEFVQKEYAKGNLTHILIVGDAPQVPTLKGVRENADSDPCYTKLAGDDHVPDCIISRLSATTPTQVSYQVAKVLNYEQFPSTGADAAWYRKSMGIASNQGNPTDAVRADWLRDALLKWQITSVDQIYDPKATKAMIFDGLNSGRSLVNYIGHGSNTSWGTTGFNNVDCGKLVNGWKLPIIWSVACVNGNFVTGECFCEAWLKAGNVDKPAGAVAIFGATTNQEWVPPC
ncbi:hypothetical protein HYY75_04205, partial [bacterium]|nr:hypothetical protein [bacterium]